MEPGKMDNGHMEIPIDDVEARIKMVSLFKIPTSTKELLGNLKIAIDNDVFADARNLTDDLLCRMLGGTQVRRMDGEKFIRISISKHVPELQDYIDGKIKVTPDIKSMVEISNTMGELNISFGVIFSGLKKFKRINFDEFIKVMGFDFEQEDILPVDGMPIEFYNGRTHEMAFKEIKFSYFHEKCNVFSVCSLDENASLESILVKVKKNGNN